MPGFILRILTIWKHSPGRALAIQTPIYHQPSGHALCIIIGTALQKNSPNTIYND